jgi:Ca-activated chloride channel family protein
VNEDLANLNLIELLDRLSPVPEPPVVSLWPQTEAWLWLGLGLFALTVWLIRRWLLHRHANAYRRAALQEIAEVGDSPVALAEILRRTALAAYPRSEVAGLYGDEWLAFLDRTGQGTDFREGAGQTLARAPYSGETPEAKQLVVLATRWVRSHRRALESGR